MTPSERIVQEITGTKSQLTEMEGGYYSDV